MLSCVSRSRSSLTPPLPLPTTRSAAAPSDSALRLASTQSVGVLLSRTSAIRCWSSAGMSTAGIVTTHTQLIACCYCGQLDTKKWRGHARARAHSASPSTWRPTFRRTSRASLATRARKVVLHACNKVVVTHPATLRDHRLSLVRYYQVCRKKSHFIKCPRAPFRLRKHF